MMDFQAGVRARLLADSAVGEMVGRRVYWFDRPQKTGLPAISLQVVSDPRPQNLKDFDRARGTLVQVDCWGAKYEDALATARAAIAALKEPATIKGKKFGNAQVTGQRDLGESVSDGSFIHRQSVDMTIWHAGD